MSGDEREAAILRATEELLAETRLADIPIDRIARAAGISRSTFYFYFATKEAVLVALLERVREEADAAAAQAVDRGLGRREQYRQVIGAFVATFREHRAVAVATSVARGSDPAVDAIWARILDGWVALAESTIRAEQTRRAAPDDVDARDLAASLTLLNERTVQAVLLGESAAPTDDGLVDLLTTIWLRAIYGTAGTAGGGGGSAAAPAR